MWLKDTSAAAGIIWNWWTHSRILATPAALLSSAIRPIQVEPLLSGCEWMYPAAFLSFKHSIFLSTFVFFNLSIFVICLSHSLTQTQTKTHIHRFLSPTGSFSTATLWPAAEAGCLRAAVPAPDSADSFRRKTNVGDALTDLADWQSLAVGKLTTASKFRNSISWGYFFSALLLPVFAFLFFIC